MDPSECFPQGVYWQYGKSVKFLFILETVSCQLQQLMIIFLSLSIAGPEGLRASHMRKYPWRLFPGGLSAAFTIVPAVSIMSSTRIAVLPSSEPMISITSQAFDTSCERLLSAVASSAFPICSANFLPSRLLSGDTACYQTLIDLFFKRPVKIRSKKRNSRKVIDRDNPESMACMWVCRNDPVSSGLSRRFAINFDVTGRFS